MRLSPPLGQNHNQSTNLLGIVLHPDRATGLRRLDGDLDLFFRTIQTQLSHSAITPPTDWREYTD